MNKQDFRDLGIDYLSIGEFMNKYGEHIDVTFTLDDKPKEYINIKVAKLSDMKEEISKKIETLNKDN
jgi:hypothetical protein